MKRLVLFCFLFSAFCFSAVSQEFMQNRRRAFQVSAAAASTLPAVYQVKTNVASSGTSVSVTLDTGTDANRALLVFVSHYPATAVPTVYCAGTNVPYLTNVTFYDTAWARLFGLVAPASGSQTVSANFAAAVSEGGIVAVAITNSIQTGTFNTVTNSINEGGATATLYIPTAANQLQFMFTSAPENPWTLSSVGTGQTILTNNIVVGHNDFSTTKPGTTTSTGYHTNTMTFGGSSYLMSIGVSVKGL